VHREDGEVHRTGARRHHGGSTAIRQRDTAQPGRRASRGRVGARDASPFVVTDMRDDHFRRRTPRPTTGSRSPAHDGSASEPVLEPEADAVANVDPRTPGDPVMRWLLIATVACIAGCALLLAVNGSDVVTFAGIALGGTAFVLVLAAAFYAVGRSEDRARIAERVTRDAGPDGPAP
jgi:hypothetical protein